MPTHKLPSSITDDCRIAGEQAAVAKKEADDAEAELDQSDLDVEADPERGQNRKKSAFKVVAEHARAADLAAKAARDAAERANAALRTLGSTGAPTAGLREQVDRAFEAAEMAGEEAQRAHTARTKAISTIAVEDELKVKPFFEKHKPQIFARLEECDHLAETGATNPDMTFIAESLPIIHSIIQVGTDRLTLHNASQWVRDFWGNDTDPLMMLSALLLIYVAKEAEEAEETKEADKVEVWKRINERVQKLLRGA